MAARSVFDTVLILSAVDKATKVINATAVNAERRMARLSKSAAAFGDTMYGVGQAGIIGGGAILLPLFKGIKDAERAQTSFNRLDNIVRSMGMNDPQVAKNMKAFADSMEFEIAIESETIQEAQAKLATFSKVMNKTAIDAGIFDRATMAAFDMQAAGFGDGTQNIVQLGKALQDPITGINALRRSGISFTDSEKAKIKTLVETNRTLEAQDLILKAVETQVKGTAKATADDSVKMQIAMGEFLETVSAGLLPALNELTVLMTNDIIPAFRAWTESNPVLFNRIVLTTAALGVLSMAVGVGSFLIGGLSKVVSGTASVLGFFAKVIKGVTTGQWAFNTAAMANPYVAITVAVIAYIAALAALVYWFDEVWAWISKTWKEAGILTRVLTVLAAVILLPITTMIALAGAIRWVIDNWGMLEAATSSAVNYVVNEVTALGQIFQFIFNLIVTRITGLATTFYNAGANIVQSIIDGIVSRAAMLVSTVSEVAQSVRDFFPFSPAKTGPLRDIHRVKLIETIASAVNPAPLIGRVQSVAGMAMGALSGPSVAGSPVNAGGMGGNGPITVSYSPVINVSGGEGGNVAASLAEVLRNNKAEFEQFITRYMADRDRVRF